MQRHGATAAHSHNGPGARGPCTKRERHRAAGAELEQRHAMRVKWWEHLAFERHPALRENEAVACSIHQLRRSNGPWGDSVTRLFFVFCFFCPKIAGKFFPAAVKELDSAAVEPWRIHSLSQNPVHLNPHFWSTAGALGLREDLFVPLGCVRS